MEKLIEVIKIVMENSSLDTSIEINRDSNLREDLKLDSLALAELAVRIEEIYNVDVFEDGLVSTVLEIEEKIV